MLYGTHAAHKHTFFWHKKKKNTFFVHEIETSALIFRTEEIQVISWVDGYEKWERIKVWTQDLLTCSQPLNSHASNCTNSTCVKQKTFSRLLSESTVFIPYPYFISSLLLWTSYSIVLFFFFPIRKLKSAEWFQNLLKKMVLLDSATEYLSYLVEAWKASSFSITSYFSLLPSRFAEANVSKTIWEDPLYFAAHCGTKFQHNVTLQLEDSRD